MMGIAARVRRLLHLLRRSRHEADLREEMETHRSLRQEKLEREGAPESDAASASRRALGNVTLAREDARGVWLGPAIEGVWQDVRGAFRSSRRSVASSLTIVVTLIFGIGLASAIFAFGDGYLARPLPFPDDERLYVVREPEAQRGMLPTADVDALRRSPVGELGFVGGGDSFVGFGLLLQLDGRQVQALANGVGEGFSQVLQVPLAVGRLFGPDDYRGAEPVPVWLSHRFWQREFGGDPAVLHRTFRARSGNREVLVEVVGVTDPRITTFDTNFGQNNVVPDLFAPARGYRADTDSRTFSTPTVRLPREMSPEQAEAAISVTLQSITPAAAGATRTVRLESLRETMTGAGRPVAAVFVAGALLALALVTFNLIHLLLARGVARAAELAVRSALGASRLRIARLLFFESLLYGAAGIGGGVWLGRWIATTIAEGMPTRGDDTGNLALVAMTFDARVVAFAIVAGLIVATFGAAWPVWRVVFAAKPASVMNRRGGARISSRFSRLTLVCEIAVSTVILMGTVFIGLGIWRYVNQPLGFDLDDRFTLAFPSAPGVNEDTVDWRGVLHAVRNVSGVRNAAVDGANEVRAALRVDGRDLGRQDVMAVAVGAGWLETRGVQLIRGRLPQDSEIEANAPVTVVDDKFGQTAWPGEDAVGKVLHVDGQSPRVVVGVVSHQRVSLAREVPGLAYVSQPRVATRAALRVWAPGMSAAELSSRLRAPLKSLAAGYSPVLREVTFDRAFSNDLANARFQRPIIIALGLFAITLASVGLFGLVAYLVEQRVRDFGIRMALGAARGDILRAVVRESAIPAVAGLAIGLMIWWTLESAVRATMFGWESSGPVAAAVVSAAVLLAVVVAAAGPARRVLRIDPAVVLKAE